MRNCSRKPTQQARPVWKEEEEVEGESWMEGQAQITARRHGNRGNAEARGQERREERGKGLCFCRQSGLFSTAVCCHCSSCTNMRGLYQYSVGMFELTRKKKKKEEKKPSAPKYQCRLEKKKKPWRMCAGQEEQPGSTKKMTMQLLSSPGKCTSVWLLIIETGVGVSACVRVG